MRFVFVDRLVSAEPPRHIETLKNVSATEDVFADHFPGYPVLPGALIVEAFAQACQLLIAMSHDFAEVGQLRRGRGPRARPSGFAPWRASSGVHPTRAACGL